MDALSTRHNFEAVDALMDAQASGKMRLVDRAAVFESVAYLRSHGFQPEDIHNCLIRYFYVDLDMLHEALATH